MKHFKKKAENVQRFSENGENYLLIYEKIIRENEKKNYEKVIEQNPYEKVIREAEKIQKDSENKKLKEEKSCKDRKTNEKYMKENKIIMQNDEADLEGFRIQREKEENLVTEQAMIAKKASEEKGESYWNPLWNMVKGQAVMSTFVGVGPGCLLLGGALGAGIAFAHNMNTNKKCMIF